MARNGDRALGEVLRARRNDRGESQEEVGYHELDLLPGPSAASSLEKVVPNGRPFAPLRGRWTFGSVISATRSKR